MYLRIQSAFLGIIGKMNLSYLNNKKPVFINLQNICILFILISIFVFQDSFGAEIDSVTPRKLKLDNSLTIINTISHYIGFRGGLRYPPKEAEMKRLCNQFS